MGFARRGREERRRRCRDIGDDERQRDRPQLPSARRVGARRAHLFVAPPRRCLGIDSSSRLDLGFVAPPTNGTVFMKVSTQFSDLQHLAGQVKGFSLQTQPLCPELQLLVLILISFCINPPEKVDGKSLTWVRRIYWLIHRPRRAGESLHPHFSRTRSFHPLPSGQWEVQRSGLQQRSGNLHPARPDQPVC